MKLNNIILFTLILAVFSVGIAAAGPNLLTNPSFETGTGTATGWTEYSETAIAPTLTQSTTLGVVDGSKSQRIQYTGQAGDYNAFILFYQPTIACAAGDDLEFSSYVRGTVTNAELDMIIGVYDADSHLIDEYPYVVAPTTTATKYTTHHIMPEGADHARITLSLNTIGTTSAIDVQYDNANANVIGAETPTETSTSTGDAEEDAKNTASNTLTSVVAIIGAILILTVAGAMIVAIKGELTPKQLTAMVFGIVIVMSLTIVGCIVLSYIHTAV